MDPRDVVRRYYTALDQKRYRDLRELLSPSFRQLRPDRTFDSREAFLEFMREQRPLTETEHRIDRILGGSRREYAVVGSLHRDGGRHLFDFVDVHRLSEEGRIEQVRTYS